MTYQILKHCDKIPPTKWLINTFRIQTKLGMIHLEYKLVFFIVHSKIQGPKPKTNHALADLLQDTK